MPRTLAMNNISTNVRWRICLKFEPHLTLKRVGRFIDHQAQVIYFICMQDNNFLNLVIFIFPSIIFSFKDGVRGTQSGMAISDMSVNQAQLSCNASIDVNTSIVGRMLMLLG